ncbi:MAG: RNA methyltransferase [Odoribacter sp.]|nr:RNA methyltransferase [Odoribacter sp.]
MNTLPAAFTERIKKQWSAEARLFLETLQSEAPVSIRLNPGKPLPDGTLFPEALPLSPVDWCNQGRYLSNRPAFTLDPCFHGGAYYVQEASSMFICHIIPQIIPSGPIRVLDLCAAPGGKSTLIASVLDKDSLLVSNEVIRSRAVILKENIIKWGQDNVVVTQNDPADFRPLEGTFDLILVDAPCSGEGMFRKDPAAITEWSEENLRLCCERQRRILSDIWPCLKPGGHLIYSTCTYNPGENEAILEWMTNEWQAESIPVKHNFEGIVPSHSKTYGYHFYPHKIKGEGFFIGVLRKNEGKTFCPRKHKKPACAHSRTPEEIKHLIRTPERYSVYSSENTFGVIPTAHTEFISLLETSLRVLYKGCELAEINNRKLKLLPPAALWQGLNTEYCSVYDADRKTALTFLRKEDIPVPGNTAEWILVAYRGIGLGWCKNLGNRLNNYYPKEWRIRMDIKL